MTQPLEHTGIFQKLLPEVENVMQTITDEQGLDFPTGTAMAATQRICEERNDDAMDFWLFLSDIEGMNDDDDWSDVNGCIEAMILKYRGEQLTESVTV